MEIQGILDNRKKQRVECYNKNKEWLYDKSKRGSGRKQNFRASFVKWLEQLSQKSFESFEDEKNTIGRYGEPYYKWTHWYIEAFKKEDRDHIKEIAREFGAFGYEETNGTGHLQAITKNRIYRKHGFKKIYNEKKNI